MKSEKGGALIAVVMICMLLIAGMAWIYRWSWDNSLTMGRHNGGQHALEYADSGINSLTVWLKSPNLSAVLPVGSSTTLSIPMEKGRCAISIYRQSPDSTLIDAYATGYFTLGNGTLVDPDTNLNSQAASINAKFRISNAAEYLIGIPSTLYVSYGTNAGTGTIYAKDLIFDPPGTGPQTIVGSALYSNSVSSSVPVFVTFTKTPAAAQQLTYPPSFTALDAAMRAQYVQNSNGSVAPAFTGEVSAPVSHIYVVNGPLDIGVGDVLTVNGVYVIYVTGQVTIHNSILLKDAQSWVAILSEQDIHLAADAPDVLTLNGNYLMNGSLIADLPATGPRTNGVFALNGGIVSLGAISLANVFLQSRTYTYASTADPNLFLPNTTDLLQYKILMGRNYAQ